MSDRYLRPRQLAGRRDGRRPARPAPSRRCCAATRRATRCCPGRCCSARRRATAAERCAPLLKRRRRRRRRPAGATASRVAALVLDATGRAAAPTWPASARFFAGPLRRLRPSGRVIVHRPLARRRRPLGRTRPGRRWTASSARWPRSCAAARPPTCCSADDAGARSSRRCASCCPAARPTSTASRSTSAPATAPAPADWDAPAGRQGRASSPAPRAASARPSPRVLARDGAHVVAADLPAAGEALAEVANRIGGTALQLDIAAADAAERAARAPARAARRGRHRRAQRRHHPRQAAGQHEARAVGLGAWRSTWQSQLRDQRRAAGRRACCTPADGSCRLSSTTGIAGNRGQTNYGASKAGVIGMVRASAPALRRARRSTINAVAPGFIDTDMTATMPFGHPRGGPPAEHAAAGRPAGRRRRGDRLARLAGRRRRSTARSCGCAARTWSARDVTATPLDAAAVAGAAVRQGRRSPRAAGGGDALPADAASTLAAAAVDADAPGALPAGLRLPGQRRLPPTYLHVLAFPLSVALMAEPRVPVPAARAGARRQHDQPAAPGRRRRAADLDVRAADLRPHPAGRQLDLCRRGARRRRGVWRALTYLRRARGTERSAGAAKPTCRSPTRPGGRWRVPDRHRPPLRRGLRRPQPDPPVRADRQGVRVPAGDRARHVGQGARAGGARGPAAGRLRGRRRVQDAGVPALDDRRPRLRAPPRAGARTSTDAKSGKPHLTGTIRSRRPRSRLRFAAPLWSVGGDRGSSRGGGAGNADVLRPRRWPRGSMPAWSVPAVPHAGCSTRGDVAPGRPGRARRNGGSAVEHLLLARVWTSIGGRPRRGRHIGAPAGVSRRRRCRDSLRARRAPGEVDHEVPGGSVTVVGRVGPGREQRRAPPAAARHVDQPAGGRDRQPAAGRVARDRDRAGS